jgi:aryl-alcohol dehydrogenase-like predicted oxidoreductase
MAVLQLPYNLFETGALLEANTPEGTALEAARAFDLGVLVNRPLNAMANNRLIRLADPPRPGSPSSDEALRARLVTLGELEGALASAAPDVEPLRVAELFLDRWDELVYPQAFQQVFRFEVVPEAQRGLRALVDALGQPPEPAHLQRIQAYQDDLNELIEPLQNRASRQSPNVAAQIRSSIQGALPDVLRDETLSRIALDFVASSPGVSCVLCGMRQPAYVEDAAGVLALPALADVSSVASALAAGSSS